MHFFNKTISFIAVFSVLPAAFALTARPSVVGNASSRMPTMTAYINNATSSTSGGATTSSSLLANSECIDAYTECIKGADACGSNFEECTNKVLFHGKMPQCLSTLAQCSTAGVTSLFGTGTVSALATGATKNSYGEITDYTYPTDGSVLGQMITAAAISNKYDTSTCVRRYTSCLKKDSVCGNDFELCTTTSEFKKQRVYCDSTLARCQSEGVIELFGSATTTATPSANSRIGELITEGAALAAISAVSTCYKVIDQCILNACATNPYKCYENSTQSVVAIADAINSGDASALTTDLLSETISKSSISGYIKNSCQSTIGANKYCYATFLGNGVMPTSSQLRDEDNQEEIYDLAYSARMNSGMKAKIADLVEKFDTKAKQKCTETIRSCAMRVCGGGSGAACYSQVFGGKDKSINAAASRAEIKTGCSAVVNTDPNCKYAAANPNNAGAYSYAYINNEAFDLLFPEYEEGGNDPIGVVASLNASLANNYSDAAIATMKRQCQSVATSCVKSMCGSDYVNCYRRRTDMYSDLTNTGNTAFDKSMNKVGGVLDYTVVLGLCLDTVKNASVCEEHLAIERNKLKLANNNATSSWGTGAVRTDWIDAGAATQVAEDTERVAAHDDNGDPLCTSKGGTEQGVCYTVDAKGNIFDQPVYISYTTYVQSQAASTLFKDLIFDLEKEAQAKYNAKITREMNMCMGSNAGGVMGNRDMGSTYMWVKLKSNKVPQNYAVAGLKSNAFTASNDLYGSFCRLRVTVTSDDKRIQEVIRNGADWSTAYFAAGDSFTCGSWIPQSALEEMANSVADKAIESQKKSQERTRSLITILGGLGSTVGGVALGESIRKGNILGGLTGLGDNKSKNSTTPEKAQENCVQYVDAASSGLRGQSYSKADVSQNANMAVIWAKQLGIADSDTTAVSTAVNGLKATWNKSKCSQALYGAYNCQSASDSDSDAAAAAAAAAAAELDGALADLKIKCSGADTKSGGKDDKQSKKGWITAVSSIAVGTAGTLLINKVTRDIQQSSLDEAHQKAYNEWMDQVGKHISCYIGGDEAGTYGDIIGTTLD